MHSNILSTSVQLRQLLDFMRFLFGGNHFTHVSQLVFKLVENKRNRSHRLPSVFHRRSCLFLNSSGLGLREKDFMLRIMSSPTHGIKNWTKGTTNCSRAMTMSPY